MIDKNAATTEELHSRLRDIDQRLRSWNNPAWTALFSELTQKLVREDQIYSPADIDDLRKRLVEELMAKGSAATDAEVSLLKLLNTPISGMSKQSIFMQLLVENVNTRIQLLHRGMEKEAATYDSRETDELMTKQLAEREDFGVGVFPHHDYPENSNDVRPWSPSRHQQELWNRFKEWWDITWNKKKKKQEEKNRVGREDGANSPEEGEQVGNMGEGFWTYKNTPYVAPTQSPGFFMAMPAMKIGAKDDTGLTLEALKEHFIERAAEQLLYREANVDQWGDHHISVTFEFMPDQVRVECDWDARDLPDNVSEVQALSRIVKFLESRLPEAFSKFRRVQVQDLDLPNRTITLIIPRGEK